MSALLKLLALGLLLMTTAQAADTPVSFADPTDRERYDTLLTELRCLVCQNQSLADSHADLAQDLRDEVYEMINAGKDDESIRAFMVARYGDFVLYKPPVKSATWLLWFGPLVLLAVAITVVMVTVRSPRSAAAALSEEDRDRARDLLDETSKPV